LMREVHGFLPEATGLCHQASRCSNITQSDMPTPVCVIFFILNSSKQGSSWFRPLLTIGVSWHIKMTRSTEVKWLDA
jgi:hypothetical protein